jgi:phage protein D/phage baseplate assembly protein gpV
MASSMSAPNELASQVKIKVDGSDVQQNVMDALASLTVDQHSHLPGMFLLRFLDQGLELLNNGPFDLTKEVEVLAQKPDGSPVSLIKGEITALEPQYGEGMIAELLIRGYDKSHRLYRESKSKAFLNIKDSDLAGQIAGNAGLSSQIDATTTVYDHLYQHNQTDLEFLMQRAWRIGYECFVADGKLYFRKPPAGSASTTLTWGDNLLSFRMRASLAEQVDEVVVKGWDPSSMQPIVGRSSSGGLYPQIGDAKDGAQWANTFGQGKVVIVNQPVVSQPEADALAAARLDEISGAFIDAEGVAYRCPEIKAGQWVRIEALGPRFSGSYLVTSATHLFSPEGLKTIFTVRGARTGLVTEQMTHQAPLDRWGGVVIGVVTNTADSQNWGRVKLKFPWMADDVESTWARVLGIGAGNKAGLVVVPAVGDEVLVAFEHGDFDRPVVLGGLWNGINELPPESAQVSGNDKPLVRTWHSIEGHWIAMYDDSENKIEIVTKDGRSVTLSDQDRKITLKTSNASIVVEDDKVDLETGTSVSLKAGSNLKISASGNIDIEASGQVNIKGAMVNIN